MSRGRQQTPTSQHAPSATASSAQGPVTEDAGVAHAEQVGNEAMQGELQGEAEEGGQREEEGVFDSVVDKGKEVMGDIADAVDDVAEWGLEQLTSVEAVLKYVHAQGIELAKPLVFQLPQDLVDKLLVHLAKGAENRELLWTLMEWLEVLDFLLPLPMVHWVRIVSEALDRNALWVLEELAQLDQAKLLELVHALEQTTLADLLAFHHNLAAAIMDAVWPPGVGVTLSAGASAIIASVAVGANYSGTLRHLGGGALEGAFTISESLGGEAGVGEKAGAGPAKEGATADLYCGVDGSVTVKLAAAQVGTWEGNRLLLSVAGGMGIADALDHMLLTQVIPVMEMITEMEIAGEVKAGVKGELDIPDLGSVAADAGNRLGAAVRLRNIEGSGDRLLKGTIEFEFSWGNYGEISGAKVALWEGSSSGGDGATESGPALNGTLALLMPALKAEMEANGGVRVRADVDLEAMTVDNVEMELFAEVDVAGVKASMTTTGELEACETLSLFYPQLKALAFSLEFGVSDNAGKMLLEDHPLYALADATGLDVQGSIMLGVTLDQDTARFIAETIAGGTPGEKEALERLQAWIKDPFGPALGEAKRLLCMELAQATHLEAKLNTQIEVLAEVGAEAAEGLKVGGGLQVGAKLDYQADLLKEGVTITANHFDELLTRLGGEADTEALAAK